MPFIGLPSSATRASRSTLTAWAARAQSSKRAANVSERQSPVTTEKGIPARTSAFA